MASQFSQHQLNEIMEQGLVRQCACPSLLTRLLSDSRYLHDYQARCIEGDPSDERVHAAIAKTTAKVSALLEECLIEVLFLEGWKIDGKLGLQMPEHLVDLQIDAIHCQLNSVPSRR